MTTSYTIFEKASGEIIQTGATPQIHAMLNFLPAEYGLIEERGDPISDRVVDGRIEQKPIAEIESLEAEQAWREMRAERNRLLARSDWTQLPDSGRARAAWARYRQALRDLPENTTDPRNPIWPEKPE